MSYFVDIVTYLLHCLDFYRKFKQAKSRRENEESQHEQKKSNADCVQEERRELTGYSRVVEKDAVEDVDDKELYDPYRV